MTAVISSTSTTSGVQVKTALFVVLFGYLVLPMSMSGTSIALPQIASDLNASGTPVQWVVTAYILTASSFMLVSGSLGDFLGRRRIYRTGAVLFAAGNLAAAIAPTIGVLLTARVVTGIGAAGVMAGGGAILASTFTDEARTRAFAGTGTVSGAGLATGPTLAGWLVNAFDWRITFGIFAAIGMMLIVGTYLMDETCGDVSRRLDWAGAFSFIGGLSLLMLAITQGTRIGWTNPLVIAAFVLAIALHALFVRVERTSDNPVLHVTLLKNRPFMGWILAAITMSFGFSGMLAYLPTYLQSAGSLSAAESGLIMLMPTVPLLFMPAIGARLINQGARAPTVILSAFAILAAGNAWLTTLHPDIGALCLFGPLTMIGTGMGMALGIIDAQAMNHIDQSRTGMAAGLLNTARGTAQALVLAFFGSALITAVTVQLGSADLAGEVATGNIPPEDHLYLSIQLTDAWSIVLWLVSAFCTIAAITVFLLVRDPQKTTTATLPDTRDNKTSCVNEAD